MAQQRFSRLPLSQLAQSSVIVIIAISGCLLLNVGLIFLPGYSPFLSIFAVLAMSLIVLLLLRPQWAIPLYILVAAPGLTIVFGSTGLYAGNLMLALLIVIGLVQRIRSQRTSGQSLLPRSLMLPLFALALVGLVSIIYARLQPDTQGVYTFLGDRTPLALLDIREMALLLGLPVILIISPALIRIVGDIKWIVRAYIAIGMVYALATIFAGPLGFYSTQVILGFRRPEVFGLNTEFLGLFLVLFANIALGQALYARTRGARLFWWACTVIFSIAAIMSFARAAWVVLFCSVLVMLTVRIKNISILLIAPLLLLPLLIPGASDFFNPDKVYGFDRLIIWRDALSLWLSHPYLGIGAGNFHFFDAVYGVEPVIVAHNQFLEVLADMGVQGLLCLIWGLLAIGWFTVQRFKAAVTAQGKAIALAYIGYYTTIVVGGFFINTILPSVSEGGGTLVLILAVYHWLLFGVVLTIPQWEKSSQVAAQSEQPVKKLSQATKLRAYANKTEQSCSP